MPTLYNKNLTLAANNGSVVEAAQSFMLMGVKDCAHGARCQLCHQPIRRVAEIAFTTTGERRQVGLDCLERAEFIRRAGREPDQGELATERKLRRTWRSDRDRRPLVASAVAFLRQRRDALPDELRIELDRLELDGVPSSIVAGEALLAYYRRVSPPLSLPRLPLKPRLGMIRAVFRSLEKGGFVSCETSDGGIPVVLDPRMEMDHRVRVLPGIPYEVYVKQIGYIRYGYVVQQLAC